MLRLVLTALLSVGLLSSAAHAQQPPGPAATPSDYILLTIIMRHDQTKNLGEINQIQDDQGFWKNFPPDGIEVESWYIAMGLGYIVTLRVPPARLRGQPRRRAERLEGVPHRVLPDLRRARDRQDVARAGESQVICRP